MPPSLSTQIGGSIDYLLCENVVKLVQRKPNKKWKLLISLLFNQANTKTKRKVEGDNSKDFNDLCIWWSILYACIFSNITEVVLGNNIPFPKNENKVCHKKIINTKRLFPFCWFKFLLSASKIVAKGHIWFMYFLKRPSKMKFLKKNGTLFINTTLDSVL